MIAGRATYTVDEVAVLLDLSRGNAYRYVREGVIPAKRVGWRWMVPRKTSTLGWSPARLTRSDHGVCQCD
jgi:excisionase family DNA binding protein